MFKKEGGVGKLKMKTMKVHICSSTSAINTRIKFKPSYTAEHLLLGLPLRQSLMTISMKSLKSRSTRPLSCHIAPNALAERNLDETMFCMNHNSALLAMTKSLTSSLYERNFCQFKIKSTASFKPSNMSVEKKLSSKKSTTNSAPRIIFKNKRSRLGKQRALVSFHLPCPTPLYRKPANFKGLQMFINSTQLQKILLRHFRLSHRLPYIHTICNTWPRLLLHRATCSPPFPPNLHIKPPPSNLPQPTSHPKSP